LYIGFALIVSVVLAYLLMTLTLRLVRWTNVDRVNMALGTLVILTVGLLVFHYSSHSVGLEIGLRSSVLIDIPYDYLERGSRGLLALLPYAVACISPLVVFPALLRFHDGRHPAH
jgi:hypothetical protein